MASSQIELLERELKDAGDKLLMFPPSPEDLLNILDQVEELLSKVEQAPARSMQDALYPSMKALISNQLLRHSDMDVKVSVASCMSELTRITAPDAPYNDEQMKEIFQLAVMALGKLSCESGRCYAKAIQILDIVAKVRSCLLMLDLECDPLIVDMFQQFLRTIRCNHPNTVFSQMEYIMTLIIGESDEISHELLIILLSSVRKENQNVSSLSWKLGERVLKNCAVELKPFLPKAVKSMNLAFDNYSDVVAFICQDALGKEHEVAEEAGPSAGGPSKAVMDHEITQSRNDGTLRNIKPLNTLEPCHQVKQLENTDARSNSKPEYLDVIRTVQADTDPVIQKKRGRESNSLIKLQEGYNNSWTSERRKSLKEPSCMKNYKKKVGSSTKSSNSEQSALRQEDRETNSCNVSSKASHLESTSASASQHVSHTHIDGSQPRKRRGRKNAIVIKQDHDLKRLNTLEEDLLKDPVKATASQFANISLRRNFKGVRDSNAERPRRSRKNELASKTNMETGLAQSIIVVKKEDDCSEEYFEKDSRMPHYGEELVGRSIKVWWPLDKMFYDGAIYSFDPAKQKHQVLYADGDEEILDLSDERWELLDNVSPDIEKHADLPSSATLSDKPRKKKAKTKTESLAKQEDTVSSSKWRGSFTDKFKTEAPKSGSCAPNAVYIADVAKDDTTEVYPMIKGDEQKCIGEADNSTPHPLSIAEKDKDHEHKSTGEEESETRSSELAVKRASHATGIGTEKQKLAEEEVSRDVEKGKLSDTVNVQESKSHNPVSCFGCNSGL